MRKSTVVDNMTFQQVVDSYADLHLMRPEQARKELSRLRRFLLLELTSWQGGRSTKIPFPGVGSFVVRVVPARSVKIGSQTVQARPKLSVTFRSAVKVRHPPSLAVSLDDLKAKSDNGCYRVG